MIVLLPSSSLPLLPTSLEVLGLAVPLVVAHPEAPAADLPLAQHPEGLPGAHPLPLHDLLRHAGSGATEGVLLVIVSDLLQVPHPSPPLFVPDNGAGSTSR